MIVAGLPGLQMYSSYLIRIPRVLILALLSCYAFILLNAFVGKVFTLLFRQRVLQYICEIFAELCQ